MHKTMKEVKNGNLLLILFLLLLCFATLYKYYSKNIPNKKETTDILVRKSVVNFHSDKDMGNLYFEHGNLAKSKIGSNSACLYYLCRFENMTISNFWIGRFYTYKTIGLSPSIYCIVNKDSNKAVYITDTMRELEAANNKKTADILQNEKISILNDVLKGTIELENKKQASEYAKAIITAYNKIDCIIIDKTTLHPIKKTPLLDSFKMDKTTSVNMSKGPLCTKFDSDSYVFCAYVSENNFFAQELPANVSYWKIVIKKNGEIINVKREILFYWSVLDF